VRIIDEHWPMLRDFEGGNDTLANPWSWRMFVRHHSDGRTLVYGWCEPFSSNDRFRYAGELVSAGGDVAMAVRRVGTALHANPDDITQCITELPAEDLD
jgi:hypothetical protein